MSVQTQTLHVGNNDFEVCDTSHVEGAEALPHSLRILLENVLRNVDDADARELYAKRIVDAGTQGVQGGEIEYMPARVLLQDFTGVPVFVDLAVMREAARDLGADPARINPQIPLDLVIDHSVIADAACCADALEKNMDMEFKRNGERYRFLKWAQSSFQNVRIVPPGHPGICHQINVERFARGVVRRRRPTPCELACRLTRWWELIPIPPRQMALACFLGAWAALKLKLRRSASPSRRSCRRSWAFI